MCVVLTSNLLLPKNKQKNKNIHYPRLDWSLLSRSRREDPLCQIHGIKGFFGSGWGEGRDGNDGRWGGKSGGGGGGGGYRREWGGGLSGHDPECRQAIMRFESPKKQHYWFTFRKKFDSEECCLGFGLVRGGQSKSEGYGYFVRDRVEV